MDEQITDDSKKESETQPALPGHVNKIVSKCDKCGRELAEMGCWNSRCDANKYYIRTDIGFQL